MSLFMWLNVGVDHKLRDGTAPGLAGCETLVETQMCGTPITRFFSEWRYVSLAGR